MVKEYKNGEMGSLNADIKSDFMMTFIDRHYYADDYGNINTYAYANLAMYPSIGKMTDASSYMAALNDLKTINSNGSEKMISCLGKLKYTDYIYGETVTDNQAMAKRLYGNDDRDGNNLRDDYNRRDWIVIPYYHTHAQNCEHEEFLSEYTPYDVVAGCKWSTEAEYNIDCHKIDTIYWLNNTCKDALNTFTLDLKNIDVRGKYDVSALEYLSACKGTSADIRYFTEDGEKIKITDHPDIHVTCDGYTSYGPGTCDICGEALLTEDDSCSHSCEECVELKPNFDHGHTECDNGEDGHPDDCHEKYGCSKLEYLYHEKNIAIYMAIPVCDDPEEFDINDFKSGGKIVPDKANLLQLIEYDNKGFVKTDYKSTINAMQDPLKVNLGRDGLEARGAAPYSYMKYTYNPGYKKNLVGYFTIEGNVITRKFDKRGEEVNDSDVDVCQAEDLQLIESVRNRVGLGKDGRTDGNTYISQKETPITNFEEIPYSSDTGDYLVTGRSHDKSPAVNDSSYYDNGMSGFSTGADLCGNYANDPDTAKNNSLIRFLCGDEHVYHIRFGSQDEDVIKNSDEFNDIRIFDEFVDYDDDAMYIDCETGELTTQPYSAMAEQYKDKNTGEYSSKADKYKNMPLKNTDKGGWKPSSNKGSDNGDYGLWITHASRGDRGMKTEYIVVKEWFGDPYDNDLSDANMQYMFFEPVMQKDKNDVDGDGDTEEPYIYGKNVNGAVRTDVYYGQGTNSRWRQLIDAYVESLKTPQ